MILLKGNRSIGFCWSLKPEIPILLQIQCRAWAKSKPSKWINGLVLNPKVTHVGYTWWPMVWLMMGFKTQIPFDLSFFLDENPFETHFDMEDAAIWRWRISGLMVLRHAVSQDSVSRVVVLPTMFSMMGFCEGIFKIGFRFSIIPSQIPQHLREDLYLLLQSFNLGIFQGLWLFIHNFMCFLHWWFLLCNYLLVFFFFPHIGAIALLDHWWWLHNQEVESNLNGKDKHQNYALVPNWCKLINKSKEFRYPWEKTHLKVDILYSIFQFNNNLLYSPASPWHIPHGLTRN